MSEQPAEPTVMTAAFTLPPTLRGIQQIAAVAQAPDFATVSIETIMPSDVTKDITWHVTLSW